MGKPKVLYISGVLSSYNDPIYQILSEEVDFTYAWVDKSEVNETIYNHSNFPTGSAAHS